MRSDITPGARFPDYQLPDHTGEQRTLSELQGEHLMILVLSRGHYCPRYGVGVRNLSGRRASILYGVGPESVSSGARGAPGCIIEGGLNEGEGA
jgi:hypothetical protein